ncbi:MAG: FtsQ-type POTRA domain-containing protein [Bdellovibrionaceae bacterium]|nr:FtsQ-type POTRA domain-containing protein [Pseudobdellovibrionaceae bacterium]
MRVLSKLITVLVGIAVLGALLFLVDRSFFKLDSISIAQLDNSVRDWMFEDIKSKIHLETKSYVGKYIWDIDLKDLLGRVELDKRVSKVQVQRKFPNKIEVKILPHEPIAIFVDKKNQFIPVARDGTFMPELRKGNFLDVPILRGENLLKDSMVRKMAIDLLLNLENKERANLQSVSEIIYDSKQGFTLIFSPEGETLKIGTSDFSKRLNMADQVFTYMQSKGLKGRVIDARFSKKVVVRLRNAP